MTRILIVGPPGSGKSTQAKRIAERLSIVAISTGAIFRAHVKAGTSLGVAAKKYMDAGDFVPDSVTNEIVRSRLSQDDVDNGFVLEGYPRTASQIHYLDRILAANELQLDAVLHLKADDKDLVSRLLGRTKEAGADGTEAGICHRLDLYHELTEAAVARYAERGILAQADAIVPKEEATEHIMQAIEAIQEA